MSDIILCKSVPEALRTGLDLFLAMFTLPCPCLGLEKISYTKSPKNACINFVFIFI